MVIRWDIYGRQMREVVIYSFSVIYYGAGRELPCACIV